MPVDRAAKTPRETGKWAIAQARAEAYASRLSRAETEKRTRTSKLADAAGAQEAATMRRQLEDIVDTIDAWQTDPARRERERAATFDDLAQLQRRAEDLLLKMGPGW